MENPKIVQFFQIGQQADSGIRFTVQFFHHMNAIRVIERLCDTRVNDSGFIDKSPAEFSALLSLYRSAPDVWRESSIK